MAEKIFGITIGKKKKNPVELPLENRNIKEEMAATKRFIPGQPSINIIPQYVLEGYNTKILVSNFTRGIIGFVAVFALLFGGKLFIDMQAAEDIKALEQEETVLQAEARNLAPYQSYVNAVDAKRQSLFTQFANDVNFYNIAQNINNAAATSNVEVRSMAFTLAAVGAEATCPTPDPFSSQPTIGCVSLEVFAPNNDQLIQFSNALERDSNGGLLYAYFPSSSTSEDGIGFTGTVSFTNVFNNVRYGDMAFPIREQALGTTTDDPGTEVTTEEAPATEDGLDEDAAATEENLG